MINAKRKALEDELYRLRYLAEEAQSQIISYIAHPKWSGISKQRVEKWEQSASDYRAQIATIQTQLDALPK